MDLSTPYVKVNLGQVEKNITNMMNVLNSSGIEHRPHVKPHKSIYLAKLQMDRGAKGITCASLSEAEVMADGGINNILIAYPILGIKNLKRFHKLMRKVDVQTIVDNYSMAKALSDLVEKGEPKVKVLIELDGGIHRGGVQPGPDTLDFANSIKKLPGIEIVGIFTYMGQIYDQTDLSKIEKMANLEAQILLETKQLLEDNGFSISITSGGSTPSSLFANQLKGVTESRAGNYIFYDMNAVHLGLADVNACALRVISTVISTPLPGYATIDAGSKALTSDGSLKLNNQSAYGYIIGKPEVNIHKLNEEHGYLRFNSEKYSLKVGDKIEIVPNHSCVIPNLNDYIYGFCNDVINKKIAIDARGKSY